MRWTQGLKEVFFVNNTDNNLTVSKLPRAPWNPRLFYPLGILFGFATAGIMAGINYERMGKPKLKWLTIIISWLAFIFMGVIIVFFDIQSPISFVANIPPVIFLERIQWFEYCKWKATETPSRGAGWGIPIIAIIVTWASIFIAIAVTATAVMEP